VFGGQLLRDFLFRLFDLLLNLDLVTLGRRLPFLAERIFELAEFGVERLFVPS